MGYDNIALFDLDGTLADYDKAMRRDLDALAEPNEKIYPLYGPGIPDYIEERMDQIKRQPGWWSNLEKYPPGFEILRVCLDMGYKIHILTHGPLSKAFAWKEKVEWFHQHIIPVVPNADITITRDKGLVYGKVLVDDYPPYMERWLKNRPRGLGVMPVNDLNKLFSHPNVIKYDGTNLELVVQNLRQAYDRKPVR
ncbi:MAG TPA: hypothetical protein VJC39_04780 [Candidatus Nanoarchaeia archaeon]|nr:hypothetical protein [Candidatus Nanoarchaeia archaeon]